MKRWLADPLLHFLVAGAALFAVYTWLSPAAPVAGAPQRQVRIGEGEMRWLSEMWQRQWRREPTPEELRALVSNHVKEELLAREAREMGLDEDDTIVRRRLAQKLEFLIRDTARLQEPAEDELRRLYVASADSFLVEARVSFTQVYFSRERRKDAANDAAGALARLAHAPPAEAAALGDRLLVEAEFRDADPQVVASVFGPQFARAVFALPPGAWHGPIESGYGLHLVRVASAVPARRLAFAEAREKVLERWREQQQREHEARFLERLMRKYDVVIDERVTAAIGPLRVTPAPEAAK